MPKIYAPCRLPLRKCPEHASQQRRRKDACPFFHDRRDGIEDKFHASAPGDLAPAFRILRTVMNEVNDTPMAHISATCPAIPFRRAAAWILGDLRRSDPDTTTD